MRILSLTSTASQPAAAGAVRPTQVPSVGQGFLPHRLDGILAHVTAFLSENPVACHSTTLAFTYAIRDVGICRPRCLCKSSVLLSRLTGTHPG